MLGGPSGATARRRQGLLAFGALAGILALVGLAWGVFEGAAPAQPAQAKPNVVLVMTDDQTVEQMRALKRVRGLIGAAGTTFTSNFATFPLCCPSRATYLTGQYSHNHGVVRGTTRPEDGFLHSSNTLPVWLRDAGYATAHIGKYLNGYGTKDPRRVPPGWGEWQGSVDPTTYNFFNYCLNENGRLVAHGAGPGLARACPNAARRPSTYQGDLYSRRAVGYINRRAPAAKPFFLSVAYLAPHAGGPRDGRCLGSAKPAARHRNAYAGASLPRPPGFNEPDVSDKPAFIRKLPRLGSRQTARIRSEYQCRRESLLAVDEGVRAMVAALRDEGELGKTLFIFTADNGFFQGEHRVDRGKIKVYEPSVRVPALMRGPGVPRGKRVPTLTGNIDLAATIVDAAGAQPRRTLDGVSLRELARRPSLFAGRDLVLESGPRGPEDPRYSAIRTSRYKYVEYATGERELYDLRYDPHEQRSLHASPRYAEVRQQLASKLARRRDCSGATCRG